MEELELLKKKPGDPIIWVTQDRSFQIYYFNREQWYNEASRLIPDPEKRDMYAAVVTNMIQQHGKLNRAHMEVIDETNTYAVSTMIAENLFRKGDCFLQYSDGTVVTRVQVEEKEERRVGRTISYVDSATGFRVFDINLDRSWLNTEL